MLKPNRSISWNTNYTQPKVDLAKTIIRGKEGAIHLYTYFIIKVLSSVRKLDIKGKENYTTGEKQ